MPIYNPPVLSQLIKVFSALKSTSERMRARVAPNFRKFLLISELLVIKLGVGINDAALNLFLNTIYMSNYAFTMLFVGIDKIIDPINNFAARNIHRAVDKFKQIVKSRYTNGLALTALIGLHVVFGLGFYSVQRDVFSFALHQIRTRTANRFFYNVVQILSENTAHASIVNLFTNLQAKLGSLPIFDFTRRRGNTVAYVSKNFSFPLTSLQFLSKLALLPVMIIKAGFENLSLRILEGNIRSLEQATPIAEERTRLDQLLINQSRALVAKLDSSVNSESVFIKIIHLLFNEPGKSIFIDTTAHKLAAFINSKVFPKNEELTLAFEAAVDQSLQAQSLQPLFEFLEAQNNEFENFRTTQYGIKWSPDLIRVLHNNKYTQNDFWQKRGLSVEQEKQIAERNSLLCIAGTKDLMRLPITLAGRGLEDDKRLDLLTYLQTITKDPGQDMLPKRAIADLSLDLRSMSLMDRNIGRINGEVYEEDKLLDDILDRAIQSGNFEELTVFIRSNSELKTPEDLHGNRLSPVLVFWPELETLILNSKYNPRNPENLYKNFEKEVALVEELYPDLKCIMSQSLPLFYVYLDKKQYEIVDGERKLIENNCRTHADLHSILELFAIAGRNAQRDERAAVIQVRQPETNENIDLSDIKFDAYYLNVISEALAPEGQIMAKHWLDKDMHGLLQYLQQNCTQPMIGNAHVIQTPGAEDIITPGNSYFAYPLVKKFNEQTTLILEEKDDFWPKDFTVEKIASITKNPENESLRCPITRKIMRHPVAIVIDEQTYRFELAALLWWLNTSTNIPGVYRYIGEQSVSVPLHSLDKLQIDTVMAEEIAAKMSVWTQPALQISSTTLSFDAGRQATTLPQLDQSYELSTVPGRIAGVPGGQDNGRRNSFEMV